MRILINNSEKVALALFVNRSPEIANLVEVGSRKFLTDKVKNGDKFSWMIEDASCRGTWCLVESGLEDAVTNDDVVNFVIEKGALPERTLR